VFYSIARQAFRARRGDACKKCRQNKGEGSKN
jgi:hypothetical protein